MSESKNTRRILPRRTFLAGTAATFAVMRPSLVRGTQANSTVDLGLIGSEGVIDTDYFGNVRIRGKKAYEGGSTGNLYTDGVVTNIDEFHQAIVDGKYANETVAPSVRSNLSAVLGRCAGYAGGEVTWDDMIRRAEKLELDLTGMRS